MITALLILSLVLFSACSAENDIQIPELAITLADGGELDGRAVNIAEGGGKVDINIASNSNWTAKCNTEWVHFSVSEGKGDNHITLTVDEADKSRSAAVAIYLTDYNQIKTSFDIIQHVEPKETPEDKPEDKPEENPEDKPEENPEYKPEDKPEENPEDKPEENPEDKPEEKPEENPEDNPEDKPEENPEYKPEDKPEENPEGKHEDKPEDNPEENPEDKPEENPEDKPEENPEDKPEENPEENPEDKPEPMDGAYLKIHKLSQLSEGKYYIGGYQGETLHLATEGMTSGSCNTVEYTFTTSGDLTPNSDKKAVVVTLEKAENNGYYIRFKDGYITATAAGAGKLVLSKEKSYYWKFSKHDDGGFVLRQSGDIDVQLIISPKARNGALLRSIAGDEEGNAIILFRENE